LPGYLRTTSGPTWTRRAPYRRNAANGASDAREQAGWRAVRPPDRRGQRFSEFRWRGANVRPPRFLSLLTGTHQGGRRAYSLSKGARLPSSASKLVLYRGKPRILCILGHLRRLRLRKRRSFTKTTKGAKSPGIHDDQSPWVAPPSQSRLLASVVD